MTITLIHDLLMILTAGLLAGLVCRALRVSVLIGYLIVGAILGRGSLGWVLDREHQLEHFTEIGVFLLLFSIGLEFSLDDMRKLGRNLCIGGLMQMLLVAIPVAFLLLQFLDFTFQASILVASAVAFSSTVLVFKSLAEWGQSEQPHGRRAIGILLFQDAALVPLLLLIPLLTDKDSTVGAAAYATLALISLAFVLSVIVLRHCLGRWLIPVLAKYRSPDLVILITVVCLSAVTLAAYHVGLPPAVGAFAAGLIFNGNRWTRQIDALVLPFRETFAAVFFVGLGLMFDPRVVWENPGLLVGALLLLIGIKSLAATLSLRMTGLPWIRSAGMGLGLAHVGEFAFVLLLVAVEAELIDDLTYQRVIAVSVGSLILTPTLMNFGLRTSRSSHTVEKTSDVYGDHAEEGPRVAEVIGAGPVGRQVASQLEMTGFDVGLVDLSPINLHSFALQGFRTTVGDASKLNTLEHAEVDRCDLAVVCVPDDHAALRIVKSLRRVNRRMQVVVRCRYQTNAAKLIRTGANHVVGEDAVASTALLQTLQSIETSISTTPNHLGIEAMNQSGGLNE